MKASRDSKIDRYHHGRVPRDLIDRQTQILIWEPVSVGGVGNGNHGSARAAVVVAVAIEFEGNSSESPGSEPPRQGYEEIMVRSDGT